MRPQLSVPVIWIEDADAPLAGRIDLHADHVRLDGGARESRRTRDLLYSEILSVRVGRNGDDRIDGKRAVVLLLRDGHRVSLIGFDRPGSVLELAHRLEERI